MVLEHSFQVEQLHRRFDERSSSQLNTDLVELHSVWPVSRRCTFWGDGLSPLSGQPTAVQISHRSVSQNGLHEFLWVGSHRSRYLTVITRTGYCQNLGISSYCTRGAREVSIITVLWLRRLLGVIMFGISMSNIFIHGRLSDLELS